MSDDNPRNLQVCSHCLMDETVPRITFDDENGCNYCEFHRVLEREYPNDDVGRARLEKIYEQIRREGHGREFDCVVGFSGGRDSTYLLYHLVKEAGLRCLPVYFNDGFGNPTAGENMQRTTATLGLPMRTISADWRESRELKIACLKASTPDINLPTDIGIASALYGVAVKEGLKNVVIGQSFRTEGISPLEWTYIDGHYLNGIHRKFGTMDLRPWSAGDPGYHLGWREMLYYAVIKRIRVITPLYNLPYVRADVDDLICNELGWVDTGAHYFDDLYQALVTQYHRTKFEIDRRKFNYSALIRAGQMSREEGLERIKGVYSIEDPKVIDLCIKRLGLTREEFDQIVASDPKTFWDYPNLIAPLRRMKPLVKVLADLNLIPKSSYIKYCSGLI